MFDRARTLECTQLSILKWLYTINPYMCHNIDMISRIGVASIYIKVLIFISARKHDMTRYIYYLSKLEYFTICLNTNSMSFF